MASSQASPSLANGPIVSLFRFIRRAAVQFPSIGTEIVEIPHVSARVPRYLGCPGNTSGERVDLRPIQSYLNRRPFFFGSKHAIALNVQPMLPVSIMSLVYDAYATSLI